MILKLQEIQKSFFLHQRNVFWVLSDGVHQAGLSTKRSFKGCLKNLKITKASKTMDVQFNKALEIKGVQPLSCPKGA